MRPSPHPPAPPTPHTIDAPRLTTACCQPGPFGGRRPAAKLHNKKIREKYFVEISTNSAPSNTNVMHHHTNKHSIQTYATNVRPFGHRWQKKRARTPHNTQEGARGGGWGGGNISQGNEYNTRACGHHHTLLPPRPHIPSMRRVCQLPAAPAALVAAGGRGRCTTLKKIETEIISENSNKTHTNKRKYTNISAKTFNDIIIWTI